MKEYINSIAVFILYNLWLYDGHISSCPYLKRDHPLPESRIVAIVCKEIKTFATENENC